MVGARIVLKRTVVRPVPTNYFSNYSSSRSQIKSRLSSPTKPVVQIIDRQIIGGFFLFFCLSWVRFVGLSGLSCQLSMYLLDLQNRTTEMKSVPGKEDCKLGKETTSPTRELFNLLLVSTSKKSIIM